MNAMRLLLCAPLAVAARGDPVQSEVAVTVPRGVTTLRKFVRASDFESGGVDTLEVQTQVVYGLTAKTNLQLSVPFLRKNLDSRRATGLGDTTFWVKQQIWKRDSLGTQERISLIGGVKSPTGESDASDRFGRLPPMLQLGTGSFDFPVGVLFAHDARRGFFADAIYTAKTETNDYRFGDTLRYDLAFTCALKGSKPREHFIWAVLELNGQWADRDRSGGVLVANSGGHTLHLSPGLRLAHWTGHISLDFSYQIPILAALNGSQAEPKGAWLAGF